MMHSTVQSRNVGCYLEIIVHAVQYSIEQDCINNMGLHACS